MMTNVRIKSQNRGCYVGNRYYEYYDVIADSERFGENAIMCQGTFQQCIDYLKREGIDYLTECMKRNRKTDVQVSFRMYRIIGEEADGLRLYSRDGFERFLRYADMKPVAPNTFSISRDLFGENKATVKLMEARAW